MIEALRPLRSNIALDSASTGNSWRVAVPASTVSPPYRVSTILAAVALAMVVLEPQAGGGARQHPRARVVVADDEGDADPVVVALAHMHDQRLAGEGIAARGRGFVDDDAAGERLAAQCRDAGEEGVGWRCAAAASRFATGGLVLQAARPNSSRGTRRCEIQGRAAPIGAPCVAAK